MRLYDWAMRNGSGILFAASAFLVLAGFVQALRLSEDFVGQVPAFGGRGESHWLLILSAALSGLGSAVLPFIGALVIHRWDQGRMAPAQADGVEPSLRSTD